MSRVLIVTREYPPMSEGGISRRLSMTVPRLLDKGVDIGVVSFSDHSIAGEAVYPVSETSKILYTKAGEPKSSDLAAIVNDIWRLDRHASQVAKTQGYQLIHIEEPIFGPFIQSPLPKIVTVHNTQAGEAKAAFETLAGTRQLRRLLFSCSVGYTLDSLSLRSCDMVIAVSPTVKRELTRYYGLSPGKTKVIPNGVNIPPAVNKQRGNHGITLACVGRLVSHKRIDFLLRALALLKSKGTRDFQCFIVGVGPSEPALRALAKNLSLDNEVVFTGWVSDEQLAEILTSIDAVVSTSIYEGWGLSIFEAASYYCAPVVSRIPVFMQNLVEGSSCLAFDPDSEQALSDDLMSLYHDPALLKRIQTGARTVAEGMSWDSSVSQLVTTYSKLTSTAEK